MLFLDLLHTLIDNATLLFPFVLGYSYLARRVAGHEVLRHVVPGIIFGVCGLMNMISPYYIQPGVFIDSRTIIVAISTAQGGFVSGFITAVMLSIYRLSIGGVGIASALPGIWLNVGLGLIFYHYLRRNPTTNMSLTTVGWRYLIFGIVSTILAVAPFWLLPADIRDQMLAGASIPMFIILPFMGVIAGVLLYELDQYFNTVTELSHERNMLRTLIDNIPDYIFIKDANLRFILSNPAHTRAARAASARELVGKSAGGHFPPELSAQYEADDMRVLGGQSLIAQERQSVDEYGNRIYVSTTKVPIRDQLGRVTGVIGISRDITAEKQRSEQLQQLEAERQRTRMLKVFIQNASHDFRTPLSIISTKSYLLWRDPNGAERDERIAIINAQITRITRLMNDTLEMIELNEGVIHYQFETLNISETLRSATANFEARIQENQQVLTLIIPHELIEIEADERLLRLALKHVLGNAVIYTPEGGKITVSLLRSGDRVYINVEDTGMGIAPEDQPHIFEPLYRADKARSLSGGAGLGLSISQKIIEGHHGDIRLTSAVGHGTTVCLELPVTQPPLPTEVHQAHGRRPRIDRPLLKTDAFV
ncbi:MAG: PAS domain-containing protein [Chloroflexi bacterium]|uniref:sensor histidine kinase n=1 Tax=Candidatus Flexifilum breve TaxID=3140694 RepID=UPI003137600A|nr:PAS domain-containing protein [Chloroflexota bacterium]